MKHKKLIYLTAFLLSLSLILLLEASSLRLLAEDIKEPKKEKVEIELLLSASNNSAAENIQAENNKKARNEKSKNDSRETKTEEADKSSSAEKEEKEVIEVAEEEIITKNIQQENDLKTEEKVEKPKKEAQETVNKVKTDKIKSENTTLENKVVEEKQDQMPAWLKNSAAEKDNSKKVANKNNKEEKADKFDLESYLAELENDDSTDQENKVNINNDSKNDHNLRENESEKEGNNRNNLAENKQDNKADSTAEASQNKEENEVYDLREGGHDIQKPGLKNYSQPEYPADLRKRNIEGEVIVSLRIDEKGNVHDLKIKKSSGFSSFDQAALKAVSKWEFKPALKEQQKVQVIVNLPIRFELK
jgi:TonB family protein